jgi:ATP-binding cassette subfamily B multidrug efflux pump
MVKKLFRLILLHRWPWRLVIILLSFLGALLGILGPYLQKHFIDRLLAVPSLEIFGFENELSPLILVTLAFGCLLLTQALGFLANYLGMREAIILQRLLSEQIYKKTLSLRPDSLQGKTVGEMVAVYATDVMGATIFIEQSLPTGASTLFPLILAPLGLHLLFHMPLSAILTVMFAVIGFNSFLALRQAIYFTRFKQLAAERLGLVNEWILNIKALKILGWVEAYEAKIRAMRENETNNRIAMVTNGQTMNSVSSTVTFLINIVAVYVLIHVRGGQVTPGELLSLLWILGIFLTRPFRQLPWFFTFGFDGYTSLKRIADFLNLKNQGRDWPHGVSADETTVEVAGPALEVQNMRLRIGTEHLLKNIQFTVNPQEFVAIVGEVGSGKSLLLLSLMGETGAEMDVYRINTRNVLSSSHGELCRHFSYVPQEGFVMSASLRENIAFDYDVTNKLDSRITRCLELSQFPLDRDYFPEQLDTEIGERGVNLSGGQKQRVSIARADYYDCPIVLMDDSLSALDVNTEHQIIQSLLKGRWSNKTRILATHRLSVLKEVDRIFFLESGELIAQGTLDQLLHDSPKFRQFIETLKPEGDEGAL